MPVYSVEGNRVIIPNEDGSLRRSVKNFEKLIERFGVPAEVFFVPLAKSGKSGNHIAARWEHGIVHEFAAFAVGYDSAEQQAFYQILRRFNKDLSYDKTVGMDWTEKHTLFIREEADPDLVDVIDEIVLTIQQEGAGND